MKQFSFPHIIKGNIMAITAADVKALRDRTGLAMMKCKKH